MTEKKQPIQAELLIQRVRKAADQAENDRARTWEERRKALRVVAATKRVK